MEVFSEIRIMKYDINNIGNWQLGWVMITQAYTYKYKYHNTTYQIVHFTFLMQYLHYVTLIGLELAMETRMASNSDSHPPISF